MVEAAIARGFDIVGAVDIAPQLSGRPLQEVCPGAPEGIVVSSDIAAACAQASPDAAILTTVSSLERIQPQIASLAEQGLPIVSTCEELSSPWETSPQRAAAIDAVCRTAGVACLGTGVNPGYLMDFLPTVLTAPCARVDAIRVKRVQDASSRRIPFQKKIGAGLDLDEFERRKEQGVLRHVGLRESVGFIADRMGWRIDRYTESLEPVVGETGLARGVLQIARGFQADTELITLTFRAAVGEPESYEEVRIEGEPPLRWRCEGGVHGDIATCAITLNAVRSVLRAQPGLRTMGDIEPVAFGPVGP